jgi:hypothetical protein
MSRNGAEHGLRHPCARRSRAPMQTCRRAGQRIVTWPHRRMLPDQRRLGPAPPDQRHRTDRHEGCYAAPVATIAQAAVWFAVVALLTGCAAEPTGSVAPTDAMRAEGRMADVRRGQLLYETACIACHREQVHWRDKRLVHDWSSLLFQVARWQEIAGQNWSGEEIIDTAAYLNTRIYRMPCPVPGCLRDRIGAMSPSLTQSEVRALGKSSISAADPRSVVTNAHSEVSWEACHEPHA